MSATTLHDGARNFEAAKKSYFKYLTETCGETESEAKLKISRNIGEMIEYHENMVRTSWEKFIDTLEKIRDKDPRKVLILTTLHMDMGPIRSGYKVLNNITEVSELPGRGDISVYIHEGNVVLSEWDDGDRYDRIIMFKKETPWDSTWDNMLESILSHETDDDLIDLMTESVLPRFKEFYDI